MSERLKLSELMSKRRAAAAAALLCGLTISACDNTVTASKASISICGADAYNGPGGESPASATSQLVASAEADVLTLQQRALNNNGSITLASPAYPRDILATQNKLTLEFERTNSLGGTDTDTVIFPIAGNRANVSPGAIICSQGSNLYPNGTYAALEQYVQRTAILSK